MNPQALVHIQVESAEGVNGLKRKIIELRKTIKIENSSSAYKRRKQDHDNKQFAEIVLQISGCETAEEYFDLCTQAEVVLLMVEGELRLDPELTLPNPVVQLDKLVLHLAAECAPYWEHRVRQKTLLELNGESVLEEQVEFLTQGQSLITL